MPVYTAGEVMLKAKTKVGFELGVGHLPKAVSVLEQNNTVKKMLKIDLNDRSNLVVYKNVDFGIAIKSILNKSKTAEKGKMDFQVECRRCV